MNALAGPAVAGTDDRSPALDRTDWLRLIGGVMFAAGALVLLIRKGQDWSDWARFFALLIPSAVLLGLAITRRVQVERQGWPAAFLVFGTLLLLGALLVLVQALKGSPRADLNLAWTFGVTAAVAVATSFALRARFQMLLGALLGVVAWLALWDKILTNPSGDTVRWLLVVLAAIYFAGAVVLWRARRPQASDLITAAGLVAVLAAALSFAAAASGVVGAAGSSLGGNVPKPGQGWNIFLLVVSLLLIGYGSRGPTRGPSYVGAVGLGAFILLTGADLVNRLNGKGGGVVGWPLILLIGGGAALVAGFVLRPGAPGSGDQPTQAGYLQPGAPPPPPPQPPPQPGAPQQQPPPAG
jgi:hypothetical protein